MRKAVDFPDPIQEIRFDVYPVDLCSLVLSYFLLIYTEKPHPKFYRRKYTPLHSELLTRDLTDQ
jgi:hypothetical protein